MSSVDQIWKRLDEYHCIEEMPREDKRRMYGFLEIAGKQEGRKKKLKVREFVKTVSEKSQMGNRYFHAAKKWLYKGEYIEEEEGSWGAKYLMLTDKGREAFLKLHGFYTPPPRGLELILDLGGKSKVTVRVESSEGALDPAEEFRELSTPRSHRRIIGLATLLGMLFPRGKANILKIKVDTEKISPDLSIPLSAFWARYREIVTGVQVDRLADDFKPPTQSEMERYRAYWKQIEERERKAVKEGGEIDFSKILPWKLDQLVMEDEELRDYIDGRLDEGPNWFMPHFFWVQLGFKQRKRLDESSRANPPSFTRVSNPEYEMAGKLGERMSRIAQLAKESKETPLSLLRKAVRAERKGEIGLREALKKAAATILLSTFKENQNNPNLHKSWLYLRRHYQKKLPKVSEILDAALVRYISNNEQPNVDLESAFRNLMDAHVPAHKIAEMIQKGSYKLIENY